MSKNQSESLEVFTEKAQAIENRKEQVKLERERKKQAKLTQKKRAVQEKLFAPILLIMTVIISLLIYLAS